MEPVEESQQFYGHKPLGEEAGRGCLVVLGHLEAVVDSETGVVVDLEAEVEPVRCLKKRKQIS